MPKQFLPTTRNKPLVINIIEVDVYWNFLPLKTVFFLEINKTVTLTLTVSRFSSLRSEQTLSKPSTTSQQ